MVSRRDLWEQANDGDFFVEWFIDGCILSDIPNSMISEDMLIKADDLWCADFRGTNRPQYSNDKDRALHTRDLINSNLDKLGLSTQNKIGGKLNGNK